MSVISSPQFAGEIENALKASSVTPEHVVLVEGKKSISTLMEDASPDLVASPATPTDDWFWLYSSGSTGRPKGTVHSHRDIPVTCIHYAVGILGIREDDRCFSAAKLFFAYGLRNAMTFPLWVGATTVLAAGPPSPDMTVEMIEMPRPSIF